MIWSAYLAIIQNADYSHIISWSETGNEIYIKHIGQLCTTVLPHYFNHKSYQSFIRQVVLSLSQLNKYGFEKVKNPLLDFDIYRNSLFKRDQRDLLDKIAMKRPEQSHKQESTQDYPESTTSNPEAILNSIKPVFENDSFQFENDVE